MQLVRVAATHQRQLAGDRMFWPSKFSVRAKNRVRWEHTTEGILKLVGIQEEVFGMPSDRASVIVTLAMIDATLSDLLAKAFSVLTKGLKEPAKVKAEYGQLMDPECAQSPPLLSGTVRTRLAFVMGLIRPPTFEALKYAFRVRNICAHKEHRPVISKADADFVHSRLSNPQKAFVASLIKRTEPEISTKKPEVAKFLASCIAHWLELREEVLHLDGYR